MGNPVVHFELVGPDPARLRAFYSQMFGWNAPAGAPVAERIPSVQTEYSFIPPPDDASPAAGGLDGGPGYANHANIFYVGVPDVNAALAKAEELGADVALAPQRNEGGGVTVAHFRDPAGNLVGVAGPT